VQKALCRNFWSCYLEIGYFDHQKIQVLQKILKNKCFGNFLAKVICNTCAKRNSVEHYCKVVFCSDNAVHNLCYDLQLLIWIVKNYYSIVKCKLSKAVFSRKLNHDFCSFSFTVQSISIVLWQLMMDLIRLNWHITICVSCNRK